MKQETKYTLSLLAVISALLLTQLFITRSGFDPYGMNSSLFGYDNIVAYRTDGRFVKTMKVSAADNHYQAYLVGSSRLRDGLDPATVYNLTGLETFNYGLSGLLAREMNQIVYHLLEYKEPKLIVIGLDFFAFNDSVAPSDSMVLKKKPELEDWLKFYMSSFAISKNLEIWEAKAENTQVLCARNGFCHDKRFSPEQVAHYIQAGMKKMGNKGDVLYGFSGSSESMTAFVAMLEVLAAHEARVVFFHSPAYITYYKRMDEIGLLDDYLEWKEDVSELILAKGFDVWDANTMNMGTTAPLEQAHVWFTDHIHYTKAYGDNILQAMLSEEPEEGSLSRKLTRTNLRSHIEAQRRMVPGLQYQEPGF